MGIRKHEWPWWLVCVSQHLPAWASMAWYCRQVGWKDGRVPTWARECEDMKAGFLAKSEDALGMERGELYREVVGGRR